MTDTHGLPESEPAQAATPAVEVHEADLPDAVAETVPLPPSAQAHPPEVPPPPPPPAPPELRQGTGPWPAIYLVGFVVLAGAGYWAWQHPPAQPAADTSALAAKIGDLQAQLAALPKPEPATDIAPLAQRIDALEHRPAAPAGAPSADLDALRAEIAALEGQVAVLSKVPPVTGLTAQDLAPLNQHLQQLDGQVAALGAKLAATQDTSQLTAVADRAALVAKIEAARAALDAGEPIGALPGAPAVLQKYATANPPTLASLRLAFPAIAQAAQEAATPAPDSAGFFHRAWARMQTLVTVRRGSQVVVGNAAAAPIIIAQRDLDAGDLTGAIAALNGLSGEPAAVFADWLDQAKSLLGAQRALVSLAAHS